MKSLSSNGVSFSAGWKDAGVCGSNLRGTLRLVDRKKDEVVERLVDGLELQARESTAEGRGVITKVTREGSRPTQI